MADAKEYMAWMNANLEKAGTSQFKKVEAGYASAISEEKFQREYALAMENKGREQMSHPNQPSDSSRRYDAMSVEERLAYQAKRKSAQDMNPFSVYNAAQQIEWKKLGIGLKMIPAGEEGEKKLQGELDRLNDDLYPLKDVSPKAAFGGSFGPYTVPLNTFAGLTAKGLTMLPKVSSALHKSLSSGPMRTISNTVKTGASIPIIREPIIGGLEGWVHPEDNPITGMAIPLGMASTGRIVGNMIELPGKNMLTDTQKELIKWGDSVGLVTTPGRRTGIKSNQQRDNALNTNDPVSNVYDEIVTQPNARANDKIILSAFGEGGDVITDTNLSRIKSNIGDEYDELLKSGWSNNATLRSELDKVLYQVRNDMIGSDLKLLKNQTNAIISETSPRQHLLPSGQKVSISPKISGEKFQAIDRKLRKRIEVEKAQGRIELANSLQKVRLAVQSSMKKSLGEKGIKKYNNLNQKWALLGNVESSLGPTGRVDLSVLSDKLSKHNVGAYSLGKSDSEIANTINNLARWHKLEQRGAGIGTSTRVAEEFANFKRGGIDETFVKQYLKGVTPRAMGMKMGTTATFAGRGGTSVSPYYEDSQHPLAVMGKKLGRGTEALYNALEPVSIFNFLGTGKEYKNMVLDKFN